MKLFRKILFWSHLVTGVAVGLVVLVMSATGVLLTYQRQVTEWADVRGLDGAPPTPGAPRLDADALLERVGATDAAAGTPTSLTWRAGADAPVAVAFGRERTLYANAYTGAVLGAGSEGVRSFFRAVTDWHRWLAAARDSRRTGRAITGACNLAFLFLVVSGFYLWWPRNWTRRAFRSVTLFRRGLSPKARDFNWHNVIGFWSLVPLFVVVLSGVVISYPWASDLVYELAGEAAPARGGRGPGGGGTPAGESREAPAVAPGTAFVATDVLVARAAERLPGWRTLTLRLPASGDTTATFSVDHGTGGQPQKRAQLTLDRRTGKEVQWEPFEAGTPGRRLRSILRFAHTGEVLGLLGQTLAGLVSLGACLLVWTGFALSWRRFRSWQARRTRPAPAEHRSAGREQPRRARRPTTHHDAPHDASQRAR